MKKLLGLIIATALTWIFVVLLVMLLCLCFGWDFTLAKGTGVWLLIILIRTVFVKREAS